MHLLQMIFVWIISFVVFVLGSTYFHELAHYIVAKAVGFQVIGYRFVTIPFHRHGYVDVRIKGRFSHLFLRKACMHGAGLVMHLTLILIAVILLLTLESILWKGVWIVGLVVNLYLLVINSLPEYSDGRQLLMLIRRYIGE